MYLHSGIRLGPYKIEAPIGAGGMDEVYRAIDTRLDRSVAVKILSPRLTSEPNAKQRFEREAHASSALNHPHICTIHDVGEHDGRQFLVMELLEGLTLKQYMEGQALAVERVLKLGIQIADALQAAHNKAVIHRDIKPANIFVTTGGEVKVLDFGLAKLPPASDQDATLSLTLTEQQVVLGTLPYMAPEQLRGDNTDARTDIWGTGAVLYEMATGQRPFREELATRLTDSILHESPAPPRALNTAIPAEMERIILKCLEKDPENRYQSAKEVVVDLRRLAGPATAATAHPGTVPARLRAVRWAGIGGVAALVLGAMLIGFNAGNWRERIFGGSRKPIQSVAILPLANLSGDPEQDYFADGTTEALINELGKIRALRVISRQSMMQYKGTKKSVPQIAHELNVEAIVEGSVVRAEDRVRISVQLIDGRTDRHLWADSYHRELRGILALQSEVARAIASEIKVELTPQEERLLASARPVNPGAHEAYLKGRYYVNRWPELEFDRCVQSFQQAIEKEPSYADAYAGLATCYTVMPWTYPPKDVFPRAKTAAQEALKLDPNQAEAYAALGAVNMFFEWDWAAAEQNLRRAVELNPNSARAHMDYSNYFVFLGRSEDAIREARTAVEQDPVSILMNRSLSFVYQLSRKYRDYATQSRTTLELAPEDDLAKWDLAWAYALQGMRKEALAELKKGVFPLGSAVVLATLGEHERALQGIKQMEKQGASAFGLAMVYAQLGESNEALRLLKHAYEERDAMMVQLKTNPALDPIRSDPRFQDLLRRMNFPSDPLQ